MNSTAVRPVVRHQVDVCLGKAGTPVGTLVYTKQGRRENVAFAYGERWIASPDRFAISLDLNLITGYQSRRAPSAQNSPFHFGFADTAPDAWGAESSRASMRGDARETSCLVL